MLKSIAISGLFLFILFLNCKKKESSTEENKLLATEKSHKLYFSDAATMSFYTPIDSKDSIRALYSIAENWCKEMVFLDEAKKEISTELEIESLVEKYRNSLYIDLFEKKIIKEKVDTVITDDEFLQYYNDKRAEYKLDGPIIKLLYVKIKKENLNEKIFKPLWENPSLEQLKLLQKYCADNAEDQILNGDKWYKWSDISSIFPSNLIDINKLSKGMQQSYHSKDLLYYIKVIDLVKPNQDPPFSFVKEQATKSILHTRKLNFLEEKKKKLYEICLKSNSINIFIK
ncbi:MAG: peptidylprolyl isomerase [Saprospiraceae bacterium]